MAALFLFILVIVGGVVVGDRLDRPYLDGSAHLGQCRPSRLAGAI
jgi:hypothetical protein